MDRETIDKKIEKHKKLRKEFLQLNDEFLKSHNDVFVFSDPQAQVVMKKFREEDDLFKEINSDLITKMLENI